VRVIMTFLVVGLLIVIEKVKSPRGMVTEVGE
jgi:hypothetical protein